MSDAPIRGMQRHLSRRTYLSDVTRQRLSDAGKKSAGNRRRTGRKGTRSSLTSSQIEVLVMRWHFREGLSYAQTSQITGLSMSTIGKAIRRIHDKMQAGAIDDKDIRGAEELPHFIAYEKLSARALAMLEDTPEGFERFFNEFAPYSDAKMKGALAVLQPHSRMFVEAAYRRCDNHPRVAGDVWSKPVRESSSKAAACTGCGWKDSVVLNVPPNFAKTTVFTIWLCGVWETAKNRGVQGIILSESDYLAKQLAEAVATILTTNEPLIRTYGMFDDTGDPRCKWSPATGIIRVAGSDLMVGYTVLSRGMQSQVQGLRANWVVADDIVDPLMVFSERDREKDSHFFHNVVDSRSDGRCWVIGSRRHNLDLYGELATLRDEDEPDMRIWEHINFPALIGDWQTGYSLWPERWPVDKLRAKAKRNKAAWELTYQQNPLEDSEVLAQPEWLELCFDHDRTYGWPEFPRKGWLRVASFDPSPTKMAGFVIADVDLDDRETFNCEVVFIDRWKGNIKEAAEHFEAFLPTYGVKNLIIERNLGHEYLASVELNTLLRALDVRVLDHVTKPYARLDKMGTGAWSLARDFEMGRIRLPYAEVISRAMTQLLVDEATTFPYGKTSDVLMALTFIKAKLPYLRLPFDPDEPQGRTWAQIQGGRRLTSAFFADQQVPTFEWGTLSDGG